MLYTYHFLGMNIIWWVCLVSLFVLFFFLFVPILKKNARKTPIDVLQQRFSKGEISAMEYEKRKRVLEKDSDLKIREYLVSRHSQN